MGLGPLKTPKAIGTVHATLLLIFEGKLEVTFYSGGKGGCVKNGSNIFCSYEF